jgi:hypothetical protein
MAGSFNGGKARSCHSDNCDGKQVDQHGVLGGRGGTRKVGKDKDQKKRKKDRQGVLDLFITVSHDAIVCVGGSMDLFHVFSRCREPSLRGRTP